MEQLQLSNIHVSRRNYVGARYFVRRGDIDESSNESSGEWMLRCDRLGYSLGRELPFCCIVPIVKGMML